MTKKLKAPKPVVIDFETLGIESRPKYPPIPVGVSIKYPGKKAKYWAFGHPSGNNCSFGEAKTELAKAWAHKDGVLCQNAKFDVDVAECHFDFKPLPWDKVHDTLFLLFLDDPHQIELGLKPSAERLLGLPPEEQDAVGEWLIANQPVPGVRISRSKQSDHYFGRYIFLAPGDLVGKYANGDVERTEAIFNLLWQKTADREMLVAYNRERKLAPILLRMERRGVPVDHRRLRADVDNYNEWRAKIDAWIIKTIKAPADINLDSGQQLIDAMVGAKKVDVDLVPRTPTGKFQTNKEALLLGVTDKVLLAVLKYRTQLKTCLGTFMEPWLATADASGGLIYTTWNQTKSTESGGAVGTRTGRLSSTPNFQNIPKEFNPIFAHDETDPVKAKKLPKCPFKDLPPLPLVRSYVVPFKGHVFVDRDYCFSPDTEVLTENGFVRFDKLKQNVRLAQWDRGVITYAVPLEYQQTHFEGELINIVGDRSTDILVTPNHQCLLKKNNQLIRVRADEYPLGRYQQLHAGLKDGIFKLPEGAVSLLAAIQADATAKNSTLAWKLKKTRKLDQLRVCLGKLGLDFKETSPPSASDYKIIYVKLADLPSWVVELLGTTYKLFSRALLDLNPPQRLEFLRELAWWDGRRSGPNNWSYFTTCIENAHLVHEMAALTGLRAGMSVVDLPSGKLFSTVTMRTNYATWTRSFKKTTTPYSGQVHCVTMPAGTVVVRRNGRISITCQSQQEPRILAHFDGGQLMDTYLANPWVDFHDYAKAELEKMGKFYDRKPVKNTNLGLIYGMGVGKLAVKNDMSVEEASELKKAILVLYPGLKAMYQDMKVRAKSKQPIRTWGGREYYCEEPKLVDGRVREFDYKLVNVLIQGSAADCTKQAIINSYEEFKRLGHEDDWLILLNVHDQITASVPKKDLGEAMEVLREQMESIAFDVPMLSEGAVSSTNWAELKDYDKRGVRV